MNEWVSECRIRVRIKCFSEWVLKNLLFELPEWFEYTADIDVTFANNSWENNCEGFLFEIEIEFDEELEAKEDELSATLSRSAGDVDDDDDDDANNGVVVGLTVAVGSDSNNFLKTHI